MIELKGVSKVYGSVTALQGIDLKIKERDFVSVVGRSGSGKSTLLHIMGLMDKATAGTVHLDGVDVQSLEEEAMVKFRGTQIGFIFQAYNLLPELNALDNAAVPALIDGIELNEARRKSVGLLERVGLGHRMRHDSTKLSGGEKQRVAIARALVNNPKVILADEPTGNLDTKTRDDIIKLLVSLNKQEKKTIVLVTHDSELASKARRVIRLSDGKIV